MLGRGARHHSGGVHLTEALRGQQEPRPRGVRLALGLGSPSRREPRQGPAQRPGGGRPERHTRPLAVPRLFEVPLVRTGKFSDSAGGFCKHRSRVARWRRSVGGGMIATGARENERMQRSDLERLAERLDWAFDADEDGLDVLDADCVSGMLRDLANGVSGDKIADALGLPDQPEPEVEGWV